MNNIAKIRTDLQLKRKTLAQISGVPEEMIAGFESGNDENVSVVIFEKLAKAMNVKVEDLFAIPAQNDTENADKYFVSNTNGIKKALRKKVELLAKELVEQSGMTDADIFKTANAIFEYAELLLRADSIDESLREEK